MFSMFYTFKHTHTHTAFILQQSYITYHSERETPNQIALNRFQMKSIFEI